MVATERQPVVNVELGLFIREAIDGEGCNKYTYRAQVFLMRTRTRVAQAQHDALRIVSYVALHMSITPTPGTCTHS